MAIVELLEQQNDLFAKHSKYSRNALVRANYKNIMNGIDYMPIYLKRFFRNLLLGKSSGLQYSFNPAIKEGFVTLLYPDKPRHPRQKYLLTVKGLALYNGQTKK